MSLPTGYSLLEARGRKYLTVSEREHFLEALASHPRPDIQTFAATLAHTGARVSEALALRALDIDLEADLIRFTTLKRRRAHWCEVPVPAALIRELDLVHAVRGTQRRPRLALARLWPFSRQMAARHIAGLMESAGIAGPQACAKGLRHAYGVAAVAAGVPLPTIAAVLGHSDITTTAIYTTAVGAEARDLVARMW